MNTHVLPHNKPLVYNGIEITAKTDMLSLTDMWKAAGYDDSRRPSEWLRQPATVQFVDVVAGSLNVGNTHIKTQKGKGGSTFAHWQIGLAYAKYLSPEFHMWCNQVVRERMEGKLVPIDDERSERHFGISKMTISKVAAMEKTIDSLLFRVNELIINTDARVAALEFVSVRELLNEAKAIQKKRGRLNRKIGWEMRERALTEGPPSPCRRCPHSGVWLFQRDFATRYMKERGNLLVGDHNAIQMGQTGFKFGGNNRGERSSLEGGVQ